jgi:predicted O-linked N-acetylglucosamine transferase (SPINDLY family)
VVPHDNAADPERRLRIGYVSADFRHHSAAVVFGPVILAHDRDAVEVVCYSGVIEPDDATARFRDAATLWRDTAGLSDDTLAARIRDDRIDVLVDLAGHSAGNRLLVFARKPAPIQVTAWGHAVGTGLDTMDYFFADRVVVPPEARGYFNEAVIDLPSLVCYDPPREAPAITPLPALTRGFVTFGCLNRQSKVSPEAVRLWAAILGALPDSRLLMKDEAFNETATRARLLAQLVSRGIDAGRVDFRGGSPRLEHMAVYGEVDLVLDPFPHGGGVSALEGLWMGVPMVTLLGERVPARMGASFLSTLGLAELVAPTPQRYIDIAVEHARSPERLAGIRAGLRARMAGSILCDHDAYCRSVEGAYRAMWKRWCASRATAAEARRGASRGEQ